MSTAVHISIEEYLNTDYEPDCDYVDGSLEERNVGKKSHSKVQMRLSAWLYARTGEHKHDVLPEQRVQVSSSRVRIPDICLVDQQASGEVIQQPPALCVEILWPDDRWYRVQDRLTDFLRFGVPTIWIVDPYAKEAWVATPDSAVTRVEDGKLRCAALKLELEVSDIWLEE